MKAQKIILLFLLLLGLVYFTGCDEDGENCENAPKIPEIEFVKLSHTQVFSLFSQSDVDSIYLEIKYKDGDEDLGCSGFPTCSSPNFYGKLYKKEAGEFEEVVLTGLQTLNGYFNDPKLNNSSWSFSFSHVGSCSGNIGYNFKLSDGGRLNNGDILKCSIQVRDNDNNFSNIVYSPEFILGE